MLPGSDPSDQALAFTNAVVETLLAQNADLDLDDVKPTGMFGDVVELQAVGFRGGKGLVGRA